MSKAAKLTNLCYEQETLFGETTTTVATLRIPGVDRIDASGLVHEKIDPDRFKQHLGGGSQWILGAMGGTFKVKVWLTGHGSATTGSTTAGGVETLIGNAWGGLTLSASSGTTSSAGTAAAPTTASSGTFTAGSLTRIGTLGDGKGNGQFAAISTHVTTTLNLLTAIDGAPTSSDPVCSAVNMYVNESTMTVNSFRFLLGSANIQYLTHGTVMTGMTFGGLNTGEVPYCEMTFTCSWWEYSTATFPSATSTETFQPKANAAGSFFINDVGTSTRTKRTIRNFTIDYSHGVEMLVGPGGNNQYQKYVGAVRTPHSVKLSWTEDADAATTTPTLPGYGTGTTAKHILYTLNPTATQAVGFYFPNVCFTNVPLQIADGNINRFKIEAMAYAGTTTTSDLTTSAIRMAWA
jgi:hypothetical protein